MTTPLLIFSFGASGDLFQRKIIPDFFDGYMDKQFPEHFEIIGLSRTPYSPEEFLHRLALGIADHSRYRDSTNSEQQQFLSHIHYHHFDVKNELDYQVFNDAIKNFLSSRELTDCRILFFLVLPPELMEEVALGISQSLDSRYKEVVDIVLEKPFGYSYASAHQLNASLVNSFGSGHIYRLDHYLAKSTTQSFIHLRQEYGQFLDRIRNNNHIKSVRIKLREKLTIAGRGAFYDTTGALRDMIQNHALVLLSATLTPYDRLEDPHASASIIKSLDIKRVGRGQYRGYTLEAKVDPQSSTETYVYIECESTLPDWAGTFFSLETGKALDKKISSIEIEFFDLSGGSYEFLQSLDLGRISQLKEGSCILQINIDDSLLNRSKAYQNILTSILHHRLQDTVSGEQALAGWEFCERILYFRTSTYSDLILYDQGSPGPDTNKAIAI